MLKRTNKGAIMAFLLLLNSCSLYSQDMDLFQQYTCLLKESFEYTHDYLGQSFSAKLDSFVTKYEGPDFKNVIIEPIILHPFLFDSSKSRVVVMILLRKRGLSGRRYERVFFISARNLGTDTIEFKLLESYVRSFQYEGNATILSDQEITLRILRSVIDEGYLFPGTCKVNDAFFEKDLLYAF